METQTRLSRHNKFISAENIVGIFSVSSDDFLHALYCPRDVMRMRSYSSYSYIYIYIYIYIYMIYKHIL